jgi:Conjugative transposon, TraM
MNLAVPTKNSKGENMKQMGILLLILLLAGAAHAGETVKGEFFVGGGVDPGKVAHTMISVKEGKFAGCYLQASGKLSGKRLMLNADKIDCKGKITKVKGLVYDSAGIPGVDVTLALPGQLTVYPGQEVIVKFK